MQIWVDADACPQIIKEILFRAAERAQVLTTLVANAPLRTPPSPFIKSVRVAKGFDVADHRIVKENRDAVSCQLQIGFDRGHTQIEGDFERRQSVFRFKPTGAPVTLQIEIA